MKAKQLLLVVALLFAAKSFSQTCDCLVPIDTSFRVVEFNGAVAPDYRNDDGSRKKLLPFTFQFYNTPYDSVYINTNGNLSFGAGYSNFSATGFPSTNFKMIAPFWSDVDIRNIASGLVYYKITPTALIVRWQQVGYYSSQADLLNDFQLIITDGSNTDLPNNYNVQFCYGDMQWTTGSASGGLSGFGGTPATVGVNLGNGTDFWQVGRFDHAGTDYDGPNTANDGVSFLDNKVFYANVSYSPDTTDPLVINTNLCDTVFVPVFEPNGFEFFAIPQFAGYNLSVDVDTTNISGFQYQITVGPNSNYASVTGTMTGNQTHLGINELLINVNYQAQLPGMRSNFTKQYRYYYNVENCGVPEDSFAVSGYYVDGLDTTICSNFGAMLYAYGDYSFTWLNDNSTGNYFNLPGGLPHDTIITVRLLVLDTITNCSTIKTINLHAQICGGVNDLSAANIKVYPNPATDNLQWSIAQGTDVKNGLIQIYSSTGQLVYAKNITSVNESIPLTGLAQGSYYLKTTLKSGIKVNPFVVID